MKININGYLKAIVSLLGVAWSSYQAAYPSGSHWSVPVSALLSTILVWLVPNQSSPGQAPTLPPVTPPNSGVVQLPTQTTGQSASSGASVGSW